MTKEVLEKEAAIFAQEQVNAIIDTWRSKHPELPQDWILPQYAEVYKSIELTYIAAFRTAYSMAGHVISDAEQKAD